MKRYWSFLLLPLLLLRPASAGRAQSRPVRYEDWPTSALYKHGVDALKAGQNLDDAVAMLALAVKRKPAVVDYQLALGCACAGRVASIAHALNSLRRLKGDQRVYAKRVAIWQQMHDNPDLPLFNTPAPPPLPPPTTPDDGKALAMNEETASNRIKELAEQGLKAFHRSYRLSRSLNVGQRIPVAYSCGWGLLLLYRSAPDVMPLQIARAAQPEAPDRPVKVFQDDTVLAQQDIIACFEECAKGDAKRADYWQSLAYANAPDNVGSVRDNDEADRWEGGHALHIDAALDAFRHALGIKRGDEDLISQAAQVALLAKPATARDFLKQLTATRNQNAIPYYLLAEACLRNAEQLKDDPAGRLRDEAIAAMEASNQAPDYRSMPMALPVPEWLQAAWSYDRSYGLGLDFRCLKFLYGYQADLGAQYTKLKDSVKLMRLSQTMLQMGLRALHNYAGTDLDPADSHTQVDLYMRAFYGLMEGLKGYQFVRAAAEMSPPDGNVALASQATETRAYLDAWESALIITK
jgi:hypothetical protein